MNEFIHIHTHDQYSQLDGVGTAKQYAEAAAKLGQKAIATTNHGNIDGIIRWQKACESAGVSPVLGCELYVVENADTEKPKKETRYHLCAIVRNSDGLQNLMKMLTWANLNGFNRRPRVSPNVILDHCQGLLFTTACSSSVLNMPGADLFVDQLVERIGRTDVLVEVMPHDWKPQKDFNKKALDFAAKRKLRVVGSNDCHYPDKGKETVQEVLLAIQTRKKWKDSTRWRFEVQNLYVCSASRLLSAFVRQGVLSRSQAEQALSNTAVVLHRCSEFRIEKQPVDLPMASGCEGEDESALLRRLSMVGLRDRVVYGRFGPAAGSSLAEYKSRLNEEIGLICELGFQRYFLIVWELINWCKRNGIMTGPGRGSVGGCLVAYCLGITDVDPIKYGLIFSRFISPARIDLPDIDMDFEDRKRHLVRKHLEDCYGKDCVSGLSTFFKMKGKGALRDVGRVFDLPRSDVDKGANSVVERSGGDSRADFTIADAFDTFEDGKWFKARYPFETQMAVDLEGQIRGSGQHAAAMCVSKENLKEGMRCNLCIRGKGDPVANWEKNDAEYMGLMKLDVLGLSALSVLSCCRELVKKNHGVDIDYDQLSTDCPEVYDEISAGHTTGIFQIGSIGLSDYCKELNVRDFDTLVHATSLWRPGTLRTGMAREFVLRKRGDKRIESIHPFVDEITSETLGIMLYQEQVMKIMYDLAGLPWKTCDTIRKVISKSQGVELFASFRQKFVDGCLEKRTLDAKAAGSVWDSLTSFGSYGFNKSHAVEYSLISYWEMWLKVHYPEEFIAASMTFGSDRLKPEIVREARRLGIRVDLPKMSYSHATDWAAAPGRVVAPFLSIKGVGDKVVPQIVAMAESLRKDAIKKQAGFFDPPCKKPNKGVLAKLEAIKAFDDDAEFTEEEKESISDLFAFEAFEGLSESSVMRVVKGLLSSELGLIPDVDALGSTDRIKCVLFIKELRYGYRRGSLKETKGFSEDLGGVYGFATDLESSRMFVIGEETYRKNKNEIEHCGEKWVLAVCSNQKKAGQKHARSTAISIEDIATDEMMRECRFSKMKLDLTQDTSKLAAMEGVQECVACELRQECTAPVPSSNGRYNIMVIGEAPGRLEDKQQVGFVGPAGKEKLWPLLAARGVQREDVRVTNVVKCWPSKAKTPSNKHITACKKTWLDKEIDAVKPIIILALGNTCVKAFRGEGSGIKALNAKTEWDRKLNCWICWCVHPASALYDERGNQAALEEGIDNFCRCVAAVCQEIRQRRPRNE